MRPSLLFLNISYLFFNINSKSDYIIILFLTTRFNWLGLLLFTFNKSADVNDLVFDSLFSHHVTMRVYNKCSQLFSTCIVVFYNNSLVFVLFLYSSLHFFYNQAFIILFLFQFRDMFINSLYIYMYIIYLLHLLFYNPDCFLQN